MPPSADIYEKLGAFYLGRVRDPDTGEPTDELLLYDSKDLTTHAVCVGMTGSGKTGLCVGLLEEAAIDGIPALVIDPKGDLSNLLLSFPKLRGQDFEPWVSEDEARRAGVTTSAFAASEAAKWRKGLASWGQDGSRIQRLRDSVEMAVYTPGSSAGRQLSILSSFAAPAPVVRADPDALAEQVGTAATGLLGLLGIDADPIRSREHILLSTLIAESWNRGENVDLGGLIRAIQTPPISRVGVLDLDSFYPAKDRFELALALNNLLAAPGFSAWLEGEPLDAQSLLYTPEGKPRLAIVHLAHLDEAQRMFTVTLLLNEMLGWMRSRPGTSSLRALLYMDEVFGFMPPVAQPPSKRPLLTLLKQARAAGLGVVLATQNPVDLDYKGLSNTGTWFLGRLQTERDRARVLDGLESTAAAGAGFDRARLEATLTGLGKRVFLMHNVHEDGPATFETRWVMSYLRGPLTRQQIAKLEVESAATGGASPPTAAAPAPTRTAAAQGPPPAPAWGAPTTPTTGAFGGATAPAPHVAPAAAAAAPALLPPEVPQIFLPVRRHPGGGEIVYVPGLLAFADVDFVDTRKGLEAAETMCLLADFAGADVAGFDWDAARPLQVDVAELMKRPPVPGRLAEPPPMAAKAKSYPKWKRGFTDWVYRNRRHPLFRCTELKEYSRPGESEAEFRLRISDRLREERDERVEKLRVKYASKFESLRERIRKAELAVQREQDQARGAKTQSAISMGVTLLSALLGRKAVSMTTLGRATTAARGAGRAVQQSRDVDVAKANVTRYREQLEELEAKFQDDAAEIQDALDPATLAFDTIELKPRKTDIDVRVVALGWMPMLRTPDGRQAELV